MRHSRRRADPGCGCSPAVLRLCPLLDHLLLASLSFGFQSVSLWAAWPRRPRHNPQESESGAPGREAGGWVRAARRPGSAPSEKERGFSAGFTETRGGPNPGLGFLCLEII